MKQKPALLLAFLFILVCYLEWGGDNRAFVYEVLFGLFSQVESQAGTLAYPCVLRILPASAGLYPLFAFSFVV